MVVSADVLGKYGGDRRVLKSCWRWVRDRLGDDLRGITEFLGSPAYRREGVLGAGFPLDMRISFVFQAREFRVAAWAEVAAKRCLLHLRSHVERVVEPRSPLTNSQSL